MSNSNLTLPTASRAFGAISAASMATGKASNIKTTTNTRGQVHVKGAIDKSSKKNSNSSISKSESSATNENENAEDSTIMITHQKQTSIKKRIRNIFNKGSSRPRTASRSNNKLSKAKSMSTNPNQTISNHSASTSTSTKKSIIRHKYRYNRKYQNVESTIAGSDNKHHDSENVDLENDDNVINNNENKNEKDRGNFKKNSILRRRTKQAPSSESYLRRTYSYSLSRSITTSVSDMKSLGTIDLTNDDDDEYDCDYDYEYEFGFDSSCPHSHSVYREDEQNDTKPGCCIDDGDLRQCSAVVEDLDGFRSSSSTSFRSLNLEVEKGEKDLVLPVRGQANEKVNTCVTDVSTPDSPTKALLSNLALGDVDRDSDADNLVNDHLHPLNGTSIHDMNNNDYSLDAHKDYTTNNHVANVFCEGKRLYDEGKYEKAYAMQLEALAAISPRLSVAPSLRAPDNDNDYQSSIDNCPTRTRKKEPQAPVSGSARQYAMVRFEIAKIEYAIARESTPTIPHPHLGVQSSDEALASTSSNQLSVTSELSRLHNQVENAKCKIALANYQYYRRELLTIEESSCGSDCDLDQIYNRLHLLHNLGKLCDQDLHRFDEALVYYQHALRIEESVLDAIGNLNYKNAATDSTSQDKPITRNYTREFSHRARGTRKKIGSIHYTSGRFDLALLSSFST